MKTEYKRDLNHSYLILKPEYLINLESYPVKMLSAHSVPSVLPCQIQAVDGSSRFCYEITSLQSVSGAFENRHLTEADLQMLFAGILKALEELREYLLAPETLLWEPEYLFVSSEEKRLFFCCLPGREGSWEKGIRNLLEYLLPRIHHGDPGAVNLGYEMYRAAMGQEISLETLKEVLYGQREPLVDSSAARTGEKDGEQDTEEDSEMLWKDLLREELTSSQSLPETAEKGKKSVGKEFLLKLFAGAAGVLVLVFLTLGRYYGVLPGLPLELLCGLWIGCLGGGTALAALFRKKKKRDVPSPEKERTVLPVVREAELPEEEYTQLSRFSGYAEEDMDCEATQMLYHVQTLHPGRLCPQNPEEQEILLNREVLVVGKMQRLADICLARPTVSRMHARIRREEGEYYLSDLNSRNGTYVNGTLLPEGEERHLKTGDEVAFADLVYIFYRSV